MSGERRTSVDSHGEGNGERVVAGGGDGAGGNWVWYQRHADLGGGADDLYAIW